MPTPFDVSDAALRTLRNRLLVYNDSTEARLELLSEALATVISMELAGRGAYGRVMGPQGMPPCYICQTCREQMVDYRGHVCPVEPTS
jgi:hypothetical protein